MIKEGSLTGGPRLHAAAFAAAVEAPNLERSVTNGPLLPAAKAVSVQSTLPVAQLQPIRLDPIQMINNNWTGIQNLIAGLNLKPANAKQTSNPFVDRLNESRSSEDADEEQRAQGATGARLVPITPSRYMLDEDPFDSQLDLRF